LLNPSSLGVLNNMFYRLPFPDVGKMEKLHELAGVTGDAKDFLAEMQDDLDAPNAMRDLRTRWEAHLDKHVTAGGARVNPSRKSLSARTQRCSSPTQSDGAQVCSQSPHWYTHTFIWCHHGGHGDLACRGQECAESAQVEEEEQAS
jgi:hypothetical protein